MQIEPAAPPWTGPSVNAVRPHLDAPFAELYECGLFGGWDSSPPVSMEQHYWPARSTRSQYRRQVPSRDSQGELHGNGARRFGAARLPKNPGEVARWHAGVDLGGEHLDMVVACQSGTVAEIITFHLGTWAMMVQNDCNALVFSYNEIQAGSWKEFNIKKGSKVVAGQPLARIGLMNGKSSMLHFEIYQTGTTRTHGWKQAGSRPGVLRDPTKYLLYVAACGA